MLKNSKFTEFLNSIEVEEVNTFVDTMMNLSRIFLFNRQISNYQINLKNI